MRSNQVRKLVYVIGMGPGNFEQMTFEARRALEQSDVIVGYTVYVDLLREHFPEKQFLTTPMRQEVERCRMAFEEAKKGQTVAMVCSGDAGVYGMSGLILELQQFSRKYLLFYQNTLAICLNQGWLPDIQRIW